MLTEVETIIYVTTTSETVEEIDDTHVNKVSVTVITVTAGT